MNDNLPIGPFKSEWSDNKVFIVRTVINGLSCIVTVSEGRQPYEGMAHPDLWHARHWLADNGYALVDSAK